MQLKSLMEKNSNLIKNLIRKQFESDFYINPVNFLILSCCTAAGMILYTFKIQDSTLSDFVYLLIFPLLLFVNLTCAGKWESFINVNLIAIIGFYWWKGPVSLYYSIPIGIGSVIAPCFQLTREWERAVLLRLGKFKMIKGPGIFLILPFTDTINKIVDLRIRATDFAAETNLTQDSVPLTIDAIAFWMVWDAEKAILEVENYVDAVILSAQTALRDAIGEKTLSVLLQKREELGEEIRKSVDKKTSEWGITIQSIEIRDIILPKELSNVMSKRAQAEREKHSRIIIGEAEIELAKKFQKAAEIYRQDEIAFKLKGMHIVNEGLKNGNSMLMVPSSISENLNIDNLFGVKALGEIQNLKKQQKKDK